MRDLDPSKEAPPFSCTAIARSRYKLWVLLVILLLALWSFISGSAWIAGKWSDTDAFSGTTLSQHQEYYFDVLDLELREKLTSHMWDKYRHNPKFNLGNFWQEAFEAAYEELDSENPAIRQTAITEIAKLSTQFFDVDARTKQPKYDTPEQLLHQSLTMESRQPP